VAVWGEVLISRRKLIFIFAIASYIIMFNTWIGCLLSILFAIILLTTNKVNRSMRYLFLFFSIYLIFGYVGILNTSTNWPVGSNNIDMLKHNTELALLSNFNLKFNGSFTLTALVSLVVGYIRTSNS
jgi:hypothetical protein